MNIGEMIKNLRNAYGLTQKELAEKAGIATITLQQYERNKREPRKEVLSKIAVALNIPVEAFYPRKEEIEDAKREAKSELWAAETLARDNGKPWTFRLIIKRENVLFWICRGAIRLHPKSFLHLFPSELMMNTARMQYGLIQLTLEVLKIKPEICSIRCNPISKRKQLCRLQ